MAVWGLTAAVLSGAPVGWPAEICPWVFGRYRVAAMRCAGGADSDCAVLVCSIPGDAGTAINPFRLSVHMAEPIRCAERDNDKLRARQGQIARSHTVAAAVMVCFQHVDAHPRVPGVTGLLEPFDLPALGISRQPHRKGC